MKARCHSLHQGKESDYQHGDTVCSFRKDVVLVTSAAAVRNVCTSLCRAQTGSFPIIDRFADWSITVPLRLVEFCVILSARQPDVVAEMFGSMLPDTVAMLPFGYVGEVGMISAWIGWLETAHLLLHLGGEDEQKKKNGSQDILGGEWTE